MTFNSYTGAVKYDFFSPVNGELYGSGSAKVNDEVLDYDEGDEIAIEANGTQVYYMGSSTFSAENHVEFISPWTFSDGSVSEFQPNIFHFDPAENSD